ncbi:MAG: NAD-dependent epimerase/dehydratase family protein, partial [Deltaproteobacteria bacterium]
MAEKILVIGGAGMLGEPVARRLAADGHAVRVMTRRPEQIAPRVAALGEVVGGDVDDAASIARAVAGCTGVHINLDGKGDWDLERRGAATVAAAAAEAGVRRVTMISGASTCEENAWFPMTRAKLDAERALQASGVPATIFRCTMFMELLPTFVRQGKAMVMGRQTLPWHFLAADDYAAMVSRAFTVAEAADKVLAIRGPEALTLPVALERFRARCRPDAKLVRVPFALLWLLSLAPSRRELREVGLPLMRYFAKVAERGDPGEANALLGAPTTTLDAWCE